jgi:hypothetical protein
LLKAKIAEKFEDFALEIEFHGRKLILKHGFELYFVLQNKPIELIDDLVLPKMIIVNNDINDKKIWKETMADIFCLQ